jgi:hypothetical protein
MYFRRKSKLTHLKLRSRSNVRLLKYVLSLVPRSLLGCLYAAFYLLAIFSVGLRFCVLGGSGTTMALVNEPAWGTKRREVKLHCKEHNSKRADSTYERVYSAYFSHKC